MTDDLIVINDDQIDVQDIMRQIRANIARRKGQSAVASDIDPVAVSRELWEDMIGEAARLHQQVDSIPLTRYDSDIVPRHYTIAWRIPILGPIHAIVRRLINAEVRRYLDASLSKQTRFNENMLRAVRQLAQENRCLRAELESLRKGTPPDSGD